MIFTRARQCIVSALTFTDRWKFEKSDPASKNQSLPNRAKSIISYGHQEVFMPVYTPLLETIKFAQTLLQFCPL